MSERARLLFQRAKLLAEEVSALEVIADDLVVLAPMLLEPKTELLVQLRPQLLWHSVVGRVTNQLMPETAAVRAREEGRGVRSDQFLAHERLQRAALAPELDQGCTPELLADHRPALCGHTLAG